MQSQGVSACVKHYAANNQETHRDDIDVNMSERALREIYLPGFKAAVQQGGVYSLMGSYNKVRGTYATENPYLMNTILKGEWGFKGLVISDWGSVHDTNEALRNGTDLEMGTDLSLMYRSVDQSQATATASAAPTPARSYYDQFFLADPALALLKKDPTLVPLVDDKVRRILRVMYATHQLGDTKRQPGAYNTKEHQATALKVAEEGIVLLKNEGNLLPLRKSVKTVAVIGANAERANSMGGGSGQVKAKYEISALQGIKNELGSQVNVTYTRRATPLPATRRPTRPSLRRPWPPPRLPMKSFSWAAPSTATTTASGATTPTTPRAPTSPTFDYPSARMSWCRPCWLPTLIPW